MTQLGHSATSRCLVSGVLVLATSCTATHTNTEASREQTRPAIAEQMAKTYGLDSFGQIEGIRYTFKAELPGINLERSWEWNPKTDTVSYEGKDKEGKPLKVAYQRSQLGSQSDVVQNEIDPAFINDQYWLLLPLHVVWD